MTTPPSLPSRWSTLQAAARNPTFTRADLAVLAVVLDGINAGTGTYFAGLGTIGKLAGCDTRTTSRAVLKLTTAGVLSRTSGDCRKANTYSIPARATAAATRPPTDTTAPRGNRVARGKRVPGPTGGGVHDLQTPVSPLPASLTSLNVPEEQNTSSSEIPQGAPGRQPDPTGQRDDDKPVPCEDQLPGWMPLPAWREFYRHRGAIGKPLSIPGIRQVVKRLEQLRTEGHDLAESLEQTMAAGLALPVTPSVGAQAGAGRRMSVSQQVRQRQPAQDAPPMRDVTPSGSAPR